MKGFYVGGDYDYCSILITIMLHGGGFMPSEPFHLYFGDVFPDPLDESRAMVRIHDPILGDAPQDSRDEHGNRRTGNRAQYLAEKFALPPRTELRDSRKAGWRGGKYDGQYYMQAYWFPYGYGKCFLELWNCYVQQAARVKRTHPFAFVNLLSGEIGGMRCLAQYNKAHAAACERIGLKVSRALGTTPQGHREAYKQRLIATDVEWEYIRCAMHLMSRNLTPEQAEISPMAISRMLLK